MRTFNFCLVAILSLACASFVQAERIELGTDAGDFFDGGDGFTSGDTSLTRTVSVDGVSFDLTVEGSDGLTPNAQAVGVGADGTIDVDDMLTFTFSNVPVGQVTLSSVGMASSFEAGETYDVSVDGGAAIMGTTFNTQIGAPVVDGTTVKVTGTGGSYRMAWLSMNAIPEPSSLGLAVCGLMLFARRFRRR